VTIHIYYGPFTSTALTGGKTAYAPPSWAIGSAIDLAPAPTITSNPATRGKGLFVSSMPVVNSSYTKILECDGLTSTSFGAQELGLVASLAGRTVNGANVGDVLWNLFASGDPTAQQHVRPLMPTWVGPSFWIGEWRKVITLGIETWSAPWTRAADGAATLGVIKQTLRDAWAVNQTAARKALGMYVIDFDGIFTTSEMTPSDLPITPLTPQSTYTDDFDRGSLGANWSASAGSFTITSNTLAKASNGPSYYDFCRYVTALGSADHYSQASLTTVGALCLQGPGTRLSASANSGYYCGISSNQMLLQKVTAGNPTQLTSGYTGLASVGWVLKLDSTGSTHTGYVDGVSKCSATDSTFSELYGGLLGYYPLDSILDNFETSDGLGGGGGGSRACLSLTLVGC
jgi:hypothetical protein